ncbi:MAG: hypothetical protein A3F09_05105 [Chlamydiae bacterium RIFCSPHIGHO2_12_FULL_49_11]|nr:MAG: hypothetical protein A3F09_05105 [Chlamydiae bacterium RIFCSPHIGHO2_12_FULL_49_11]
MSKTLISEPLLGDIEEFLKKNRKADLITTYLFYLEKKFKLDPVIFIKEKKIYQSEEDLIRILEENNALWRETEIKIRIGKESVNEQTNRVYICPYSGKVFGDNTHPNPQDAIYDWVSKCPENTERVDGIRVKRFFVSDDPEIIRNYIQKPTKEISKIVFTSLITGKLFGNKNTVVHDLKQNYIKHIPMKDVPTQNRFEIQEGFLQFIQNYLDESRIGQFVETLSSDPRFAKYVEKWLEEPEEEAQEA